MSGTVLYRALIDVDDEAEQHRYAASWLDSYWESNEAPIRRLNRRFQLAAAALVAQIAFWTVSRGGTLG